MMFYRNMSCYSMSCSERAELVGLEAKSFANDNIFGEGCGKMWFWLKVLNKIPNFPKTVIKSAEFPWKYLK